ncbi:MAG: nucleotidyltransferase domain-containing protein [Nitrososphaeria archaeon]
MSRINLIDLEIEHSKDRSKYLNNIIEYLKTIKDVCKRFDSNCKLLVFGSYARGNMKEDSDIDLLLITEKASSPSWRGKVLAAIGREIGLTAPFEIHIITLEEYMEWYSKFIDVYKEV